MLDKLGGVVEKLKYLNRKILSIDEKQTEIQEAQCKLSKKFEEDELAFLTLKKNVEKQLQYVNFEYLKIPEMKEKKVLLVGFYGAVNLGDELMLEKIYKDLSDIHNEIYVMMCDNPDLDVFRYPGMNIIHYPKTKFDISHLADLFSCVVFGGGAIIDDDDYSKETSYQYHLGKIFIELSTAFVRKGKKVHVIGVSTNDKLLNIEYKDKLKEIIDNSSSFSVRDTYSKQILEDICGHEIQIIHDIVLTNEVCKISRATPEIYKIGIIWICQNDTRDDLIRLLDSMNQVYSGTAIEVVLIPFYDYRNCDANFYKSICDQVQSKNVKILDMSYTYDQIIDKICGCNFIVSMRYHGALLGLMNNRKTLALLYGKHKHYYNKMTDLFAKYGCKEDLFMSIDQLIQELPVLEDCDLDKNNEIVFDHSKYRESIRSIINEVL